MLKLMYITNKPEIAKFAERTGVDRIFVDMEYVGKDKRQFGLNTVQNRHTLEDVKNIASAVRTAKVLVRVNPIHAEVEGALSNKEEIDGAIENGANILMLPYFKTAEEVETFIKLVDGRCKVMLLLETIDAVNVLDDILKIKGIDEIHIGLNDLYLSMHQKFLFEPLADGLVDQIAQKIKGAGIPFGFGGIAKLGAGDVPSENIICEHYRLGSSFAILSRSFCDANVLSFFRVRRTFFREVRKIRRFEKEVSRYSKEELENMRIVTCKKIYKVARRDEL